MNDWKMYVCFQSSLNYMASGQQFMQAISFHINKLELITGLPLPSQLSTYCGSKIAKLDRRRLAYFCFGGFTSNSIRAGATRSWVDDVTSTAAVGPAPTLSAINTSGFRFRRLRA